MNMEISENPTSEVATIEKSIISDCIRLSLAEGSKPGENFRELKRKPASIKKLENPVAQ